MIGVHGITYIIVLRKIQIYISYLQRTYCLVSLTLLSFSKWLSFSKQFFLLDLCFILATFFSQALFFLSFASLSLQENKAKSDGTSDGEENRRNIPRDFRHISDERLIMLVVRNSSVFFDGIPTKYVTVGNFWRQSDGISRDVNNRYTIVR